jgi:hypothetical protein
MRDIACGGYVAGGNAKWFDAEGDLGKIATAIQDRLNYQSDPEAQYGSLLAFPMSPSQWNSGSMDTVMSISSRMLPWDVEKAQGSSFPGGTIMWAVYSAKLGLHTIHYGEDVRASENHEFVSQGSVNNSLCFLGPHRVYAPLSVGDKHELIPGQGHFGPDAVPGDARWRRGEVVSLKAAREAIATTSMMKFGFA